MKTVGRYLIFRKDKDTMPFLEYLRQFNFISVLFRLLLATFCGGVIGYGRAKRRRAAGFRTYMLTCLGAALTLLIASYDYEMLRGPWADIAAQVGMKFDAGRYASQVISGIGFLGAGTILATAHFQVSGLTTATGLFTSVCMGLAVGAGFYELVIITVILVVVVMNIMTPLEVAFKRRVRNITLYVEFDSTEDLATIIDVVKGMDAQIFDIDLERLKKDGERHPGAVFAMKMAKGRASHSDMLSSIAELPCVHSIRELIA